MPDYPALALIDEARGAEHPHAGQLEQVHRELERMRAYARALETRCNVLWAYVPGNQGNLDPIIPFLAEDLGITATTVTHVEILASHD